MKKIFVLISVLALLLVGCKEDTVNKDKVLNIGASPVPHGEILNFVKPILAERGIELNIIEFSDYITPNLALDVGEIDANFFQHIPYMEAFKEEHGLNIVSIGGVHIEPMGAYSNKIDSIDDLGENSIIAIPNDPTNEGRALLLLQSQGLIKLRDEKNLAQTPRDIVENKKKLEFKELEAATLPRVLDDVDIAIINTNYALNANLNPKYDSLLVESKDSPYINIISVRERDKDSEKLNILMEALNSEDTRVYIEEKYDGTVFPGF